MLVTKEFKSNSSYRSIFKATSIFGGVQVFSIVIAILRSKFIALLLGPAGMGISGLLTSTTTFIGSLTEFGLSSSAVRDVAAANSTGNGNRIATVVTVVRRWVWITGLLGALVMIIISKWLSKITFGNTSYTLAFIWISISLIFTQLTNGQIVLLQGMRKLRQMAKASVVGSVIGLFVSVPLFYLYGVDGIVPSIILASITSFILAWYFAKEIKIPSISVSKSQTISEGKGMLTLGLMISMNGIITLGVSYLVRIYISNKGGLADVGLYASGTAIINTYVGLIFSAMSTDYYPRLAAVAHDNDMSRKTINEQAEIALLILAPVVILFLVFVKWVILILYSSKFIGINSMIHWAAVGMIFKAASWSVSFILLAKGAARIFFWNELLANLYILGFNIAGYHYFGLTGLGISFMLGYLVYLIQVYILTHIKYGFSFQKRFVSIFVIQLLLASFCFLIIMSFSEFYSLIFGVLVSAFSIWYSYKQLTERLNVTASSLLKKLYKK